MTLTRVPAWEVGVLMRVDDAVLTVDSKAKAKAKTDPKAPPEPIPADNIGGLKALFRGLAIKKAAKAKTSGPEDR